MAEHKASYTDFLFYLTTSNIQKIEYLQTTI